MQLGRKFQEYAQLSPHVAEILSPLKSLGVAGFFYIRQYADGRFMDLTSNPIFAEHCFRKCYATDYSIRTVQEHLYIDSDISLWELNPHDEYHQDAKKHFSYGNGITLCETGADYKEMYSFYSMADQTEMSAFYLRNIDLLKKFKTYFLERGKALIDQADSMRFLLPEPYRQLQSAQDQQVAALKAELELSPNKLLTPREEECLYLILRGHTAKGMARVLEVSVRTVEFHVDNLKRKLKCFRKNQLVHTAIAQGYFTHIPERFL